MSGASDDALVAVLADAQRLGFLGARPIPEVIEHARAFVRALEHLPQVRCVLDLGSGGGVPGLIIAHDRPDLELTLLDRRSKRTDFLERAVRRLGLQDRVTVMTSDAAAASPGVDAVVARGFGPPTETLRHAARLVRRGGAIVVSEPPEDRPSEDRWDVALLESLGLERRPAPTPRSDLEGRVAVFIRT